MHVSRRKLLTSIAIASVPPVAHARAQAKSTIKIGVLTDLSGTYRDNTGPTSVACCRQAVEEFAASHGLEVELISADHQNKPDVASSIARQWFDQGVDAIADVPTSSVALAVSQIAKEKDRILLDAREAAGNGRSHRVSAARTRLSGASTLTRRPSQPAERWSRLATIAGSSSRPTTSSAMTTSETFYWDMNERTRAFTKRVLPKTPKNYPSQAHASAYAITLHYLKAVAAVGPAEAKLSGRMTVARMKSIPTDDDAFGKSRIRGDGRGEFPSYLLQVENPRGKHRRVGLV